MKTRLLMIEELEPGMRVKLIENEMQGYDLGCSNPVVGSEWECEGTVDTINLDEMTAIVEWDNGYMNMYIDGDLTPAKSTTAEGNFASIW